jgi:hypothetical protein
MTKYNRRRANASLATDKTLTFAEMIDITKSQIILLNAYLPRWYHDDYEILKDSLNTEQYIGQVFHQLETYEAEVHNGKYKCPVCDKSTVEFFPGMICHTQLCSNKNKLYFQFDYLINELGQEIVGRKGKFATFIALLEEIKEKYDDAANVSLRVLETKVVAETVRDNYCKTGLNEINLFFRRRQAQRTRRQQQEEHHGEEE